MASAVDPTASKAAVSSTSTEIQPPQTLQLVQNPKTDADRFLNGLYNGQKINAQGFLKDGVVLPPMPFLKSEGMERLNIVLDKILKIKAFEQPSEMACRQMFLKFDLNAGRIYLVGGIVPWIMGSDGLYEAGSTLMGEEEFQKIYNIESLRNFDIQKGDTDARYIPSTQTDPVDIAEDLLKSVAADFRSQEHSLEEYCNELRMRSGPFAVFHPFFDLDKGKIDRQAFRISYQGPKLELDLFIASINKLETLLTLQDLTLDITDYLTGKSTVLRPSGKAFQGWQAIVALLGKLLQLQSLTPHAWVRAKSKKISGYRSLSPFPKELYEKMSPFALHRIFENAVSGHLGRSPVAAAMFLIETASDMFKHGIHVTDVGQITRGIKLAKDLPNGLNAFGQAHRRMPLDVLMAALRVACHTTEGIEDSLVLQHEGYESTIQLTVSESLDILIATEMTVSGSREPLIDLLKAFDLKVKGGLILFELIAQKFPDLIPFACEKYLKNREEDPELVFKLMNYLFASHFEQAVQIFRIHLHRAAKIDVRYMDFFIKIIGNLRPDVQGVTTIISLAQAVERVDGNQTEKVLEVLEQTVTRFLNGEHSVMGAYLLRLSVEGVRIKNGLLWLQCVQELFPKKPQDAIKLWLFADRQGIRLNKTCPEHLFLFMIAFIETLYAEKTVDCLRVGDSLQEWLPDNKDQPGRVQELRKKKKDNALEVEAARHNLQALFQYFENPGKRENPKKVFEDLIKIVSGDPVSFQSNVNRLNRLIPVVNPLFSADISTFYGYLLDLVESAFRSNFHSDALLQIFGLLISGCPTSPRTLQLLIDGLNDDRLVGSSDFSSKLQQSLPTIFQALFGQSRHREIVLLFKYCGKQALLQSNLYGDICIRALLFVLEQPHGIDLRRCPTYLQMVFDKKAMLNPDQLSTLEKFIDALQANSMTVESLYWIQVWLNTVVKQVEFSDRPSRLLNWTAEFVRVGAYSEATSLMESQLQFPALQNQLFNFVLNLPDEAFDASSAVVVKIVKPVLAKKLESFHVTSKVNRLMKSLWAPPSSQRKFTDGLELLAINPTDEGISDLLQQCKALTTDLSMKGWVFYRAKFQEYLKATEASPSDPTIVKCLRASQEILDIFCAKRIWHFLSEIERAILYYENPKNPVKEWSKDSSKRAAILDDMASLLTARFQLTKPEKLKEQTEKFLTSKSRLNLDFAFKNKEIFQKFLLVFSGILISRSEPEMIIRGLKILRDSFPVPETNEAEVTDLIVDAIKQTAKLTDADRLECKIMLSEECQKFFSQNPMDAHKSRISEALEKYAVSLPEVKTSLQSNIQSDVDELVNKGLLIQPSHRAHLKNPYVILCICFSFFILGIGYYELTKKS